MYLFSFEIEKVFGNYIEYIRIPHEKFITKNTFLTIIYKPEYQKPDEQITLQDYLDRIDDAIKRGVI